MNGSPVTQEPQIAFFGEPGVDVFLCLSSAPGTPIYSRPAPGAGVLGYTS
jgi:hypothetical protein